eukprot:3844501-Rhodomonas_salina.1
MDVAVHEGHLRKHRGQQLPALCTAPTRTHPREKKRKKTNNETSATRHTAKTWPFGDPGNGARTE